MINPIEPIDRPRVHVCGRITYHYYDSEKRVVVTYPCGLQTMRPMTDTEMRHAEQARLVRLEGWQFAQEALRTCDWRMVIALLVSLIAVIAAVDGWR